MEYQEEWTFNSFDMGERIRKLREDAGVTCQEMAEKLGGTAEDYAEMECGKLDMSLEAALKIASFFDVKVDFMIYGKEESAQELSEDGREKEILALLEKSRAEQRQMALKKVLAYLEE